MELRRLVIRNYGDVKELDVNMQDTVNCVSETVANAICHVLNNQFAIRHYNSVELTRDTYLFGEIYHYVKGKATVYTTEIKGFNAPVFTKNGEKITDDEVDNDPILTRPYREDNSCVFCAHTQNTFLDYGGFLPSLFFRLSEYSSSFKVCIESKAVLCNIEKDFIVVCNKGKPAVYRRVGKSAIRLVENLSECDELCMQYTIFLMLSEMIDYHQQLASKGGTVTRTPIIADGLICGLDDSEINAKLMVGKAMKMGRQVFFVERNQQRFKEITSKLRF